MNRQARIERDRYNRQQLIDRARDALRNATPGPWGHYTPDYGKPNPVFGATPGDEVATVKRREDHALIALAPELAAEVVRLHDELEALANQIRREGTAATAFYELHDERVAGKWDTAARIRQAIEGDGDE